MDKPEETVLAALKALDDLPKLNPETVALANDFAAIAEFAKGRPVVNLSPRRFLLPLLLLLLLGSAAAETSVRLSGGFGF